jgi:HEAT repeat protein
VSAADVRIVGVVAAALLAAACSNDAPFGGEGAVVQRIAATSAAQPARDVVTVRLVRAGSRLASVRAAALAEVDADPAATREAALRALRSDVADLRRGAANALARVADAACTADLAAALARADDDEAAPLGVALGRAGTPEAGAALVAAVDGAHERRSSLAAPVVRDFAGKLDVDRLRAAAAPERPASVRTAALIALGGHAEPRDHDLFLAASRETSPSIRAAAARGLFAAGGATSDDVRRLVVADPEERVRTAAAAAAVVLPTATMLPPLVEAMTTLTDDDAVPAALGALGSHHDAASFDALADFVRDDTQTNDLRGVAIRALAASDRARAVDFLKRESAIFDVEVRVYSDEILAAAGRR